MSVLDIFPHLFGNETIVEEISLFIEITNNLFCIFPSGGSLVDRNGTKPFTVINNPLMKKKPNKLLIVK